MTVPTRTPLNWVKPFCKKYADIREAVKYFLGTFSAGGEPAPICGGVEKGGRKRPPELVPRPSRNTWQGNKQQRSKSMKPSQPQSGSNLSCFLLYSWQIMEKRVTSGLAMKSPMTMSNPEIGLLAKHTCKRLVRVEKKYCLNVNCSTGVHVPLRTWLNMKNVFQPKVNGSCYLNLSNAS